jgi:prolyl 4-hydroxylase
MTVDFGAGYKEAFYAYRTPDVSTFYNASQGSRKEVAPRFTGLYGKFINLGKDALTLYWDGGRGSQPVFISDIEPFGATGTSTYPSHAFFAVIKSAPDNGEVKRWTISKDNMVYYYDPYGGTDAAAKVLSTHELQLYQIQLQNLVFSIQYKMFTGRDWLALYKHKKPPRFHMWRADSINQTYEIQTKEIHFVEQPDQDELERGMSAYGPRPDQIDRMRKYRDTYLTLNLTLTVVSCAPRVFEIRNFLSPVEVNHILSVASRMELERSTVNAGGGLDSSSRHTSNTRTSKNSWLPRKTDFVMDTIYRRAADVLQMNEALLRSRRASEIPELTESHVSVAERLQLVHYNVGEEYKAHHDFAMPALVNFQPSRFATLLFYLNDDFTGGETSFPRWLNAETDLALNVRPEKGKAALFYSMLPDGNYDERSQHASVPVLDGEKWYVNKRGLVVMGTCAPERPKYCTHPDPIDCLRLLVNSG